MMKRIVLCADDYGQSEPISQGIINLIQMGRLSATSCMTNMPLWPEHARWLLPFCKQIDIGLHFNLTEGKPLSKEYLNVYGDLFFSLNKLFRYGAIGRLNKPAIEAECHAQIDSFINSLGFLPHFIDGHQHVHQFPVIRRAIIKVYEARLREQHAYVRLVNGKLSLRNLKKDLKKWLIHGTGTRALNRLLTAHYIPHNLSFSGIYTFKKTTEAIQYKRFFTQFLQEIGDKGLIMCHPGLMTTNALTNSQTSDGIAVARFAEYQYLVGGEFLKDCYDHKVRIGRFK